MKCLENTASGARLRRGGHDWLARTFYYLRQQIRREATGSHRSLRDGSGLSAFQAFHAWLPSCGPSGTEDAFLLSSHAYEEVSPLSEMESPAFSNGEEDKRY